MEILNPASSLQQLISKNLIYDIYLDVELNAVEFTSRKVCIGCL